MDSETKQEFSKVGIEFIKVREEMDQGFKKVNNEFVKVREEMNQGFKKVNNEFVKVREEMKEGFEKVDRKFEKIDLKFEQVQAQFYIVHEKLKGHDEKIDTLTRSVVLIENTVVDNNHILKDVLAIIKEKPSRTELLCEDHEQRIKNLEFGYKSLSKRK